MMITKVIIESDYSNTKHTIDLIGLLEEGVVEIQSTPDFMGKISYVIRTVIDGKIPLNMADVIGESIRVKFSNVSFKIVGYDASLHRHDMVPTLESGHTLRYSTVVNMSVEYDDNQDDY